MDAKLNYNQIIIDASNRFNAIVNACMNSKDYPTIAGLTCSSMYSCEKDIPAVEEEKPVLDQDLRFNYKGYDFEFSSCTNITSKDQIIGLTNENIDVRFPHGIFTDRYVCWMYGHKDIEGHTRDEVYEAYWVPEVYLVPYAWSYGADFDLVPGNKVAKYVIEDIDKFLETFKE